MAKRPAVAAENPQEPEDAYTEPPGQGDHDQAHQKAMMIRAFSLRARRKTYQQIADELGYADASGIRRLMLRALDERLADRVSELRVIENLSLDKGQEVVLDIIEDDNLEPAIRLRAVDSLVRLSARRGRLNGLDAPVEVAISSGVQAQLADALSELREVMFGDGDTVLGETVSNEPADP